MKLNVSLYFNPIQYTFSILQSRVMHGTMIGVGREFDPVKVAHNLIFVIKLNLLNSCKIFKPPYVHKNTL